MISLSAQLFREVCPGFFRVLAGRNAAVYLDVLDALEGEASERHEGIATGDGIHEPQVFRQFHPRFRVAR